MMSFLGIVSLLLIIAVFVRKRGVTLGSLMLCVWFLLNLVLFPSIGFRIGRKNVGPRYLEDFYLQHKTEMWDVADRLMTATEDSCLVILDEHAPDSTVKDNLMAGGIYDENEIEGILSAWKKSGCKRIQCIKNKETRRVEFVQHYIGLAGEGYMFLYDGADADSLAVQYTYPGIYDAVAFTDSVVFTVAAGAAGSVRFNEEQKAEFLKRREKE